METFDSFYSHTKKIFDLEFFKVEQAIHRPLIKDVSKQTLFLNKIYLIPESVHLSRRVYNFMNLSKDLGGFTKFLMDTCRILMIPISGFLFHIDMIKYLFYARSNDNQLLYHSHKNNTVDK